MTFSSPLGPLRQWEVTETTKQWVIDDEVRPFLNRLARSPISPSPALFAD